MEGKPAWLPYAIAGVACVIVLFIVLGIAMGSSGGGGGGGAATNNNGTATTTTSATGAYYLASDGTHVAIYSNSGNLVSTSSILVSDLDSATVGELNSHIPFSNVGEAEAKVAELEKAASNSGMKNASSPGANASSAEVSMYAVNPHTGESVYPTVRRGVNGFVISDSSTKAYTRAEIEAMNLSDAELFIARNEIVARQGYRFKNDNLRNYFIVNCSWYNPISDTYSLSGIPADNADVILEIERARGSWYPDIQ